MLRGDKLEVLTPDRFRTSVEQHLTCYREEPTKRGVVEIGKTMTLDQAKCVLASFQLLDGLPLLEILNPVRLPILRKSGLIELLPEGYDEEARSFTFSSGIDYDTKMSLDVAKEVIEDLLGEFCFAPDYGRSKSVSISAMFTVFARGVLTPNSPVPFFIYTANAEGAGKSLNTDCALVPVYGLVVPESMPESDGEMKKGLLASLIAGSNYLFFDNAKGHINFPSLEAFLSGSAYGGRVLGTSTKFSGENNTTGFMTGNGITISADLRRRSLFCELVMEAEKAEDRTFRRILDRPALLERRPVILSALWAIVRAWDEAGRPKASRGHASFPRWADSIGGIVEFAGWSCPLQAAEMKGAGDTDTDDMRNLVLAMPDGERVKFGKLVSLCQQKGLFERLIPPDDGFDDEVELDPKIRSTLSKIFGRFSRRVFGGMVRFYVDGHGHGRRYLAMKEKDEEDQSLDDNN